ncbi:MAG: hypothetical protein O2887_16900 [Bacteroidetes bacterium]|nr:hypothetical protein [Bacteroidota bacterium]MDA1122139.1 hypothetical protein [Bacteroidota bacterium]
MANPKFKELSPEQQKFIEELQIEDTRTIDAWHSLFLGLAHFDKRGDLLRSAGCFFNTFFSAIIFFGVVWIILLIIDGDGLISYILPILAIVVSIILFSAAKRYYKEFEDRDIPNPLRSFLVPLLELLQQQSAGDSMMKLTLDLKPMGDLIGTKVEEETTDPFDYLSLSTKLPDSGMLAMKVSARGVRYPDNFRLTHVVVLKITYDGNTYHLAEGEGSFNITQEDNKIILKAKYKEHCKDKVEHDPGPHYRKFADLFLAIQEAVEKKSHTVRE